MQRNLERFSYTKPTDKVWWYPYWYLRPGRKTWQVAWVDPTLCADRGSDPRAAVEVRYGRLDGFEGPIQGAPPLHVGEIMEGAHFQIKLPERKRDQRAPKLEPVLAVQ
jgi:hypothetical protein